MINKLNLRDTKNSIHQNEKIYILVRHTYDIEETEHLLRSQIRSQQVQSVSHRNHVYWNSVIKLEIDNKKRP